MISIKHLDHISMGHADWKAQAALLQRLLGFKLLHSFGPGDSDFDGCVSQVPGTGIEFEVISPAGPRSFVQRFLNSTRSPARLPIRSPVRPTKSNSTSAFAR